MKSQAEVDALLTLLVESETLVPTNWDTEQLEFDASISTCPTMSELQSFSDSHERLGEAVFEDPHTALVGSHLRRCRTCRLSAEAMVERTVTRTPVVSVERRAAPALWRVAASFLGLGFLTWFTITPTPTPSPTYGGAHTPTVASRTNRAVTFPRDTTLVADAGVDIAALELEINEAGKLVQPFEISVRPNLGIQVLQRGFNGDCGCDRLERHEFVLSERTEALVYYRVEVEVDENYRSERFLQVVAGAELLAETVTDDALCCMVDNTNPAQCVPDGFLIASTTF